MRENFELIIDKFLDNSTPSEELFKISEQLDDFITSGPILTFDEMSFIHQKLNIIDNIDCHPAALVLQGLLYGTGQIYDKNFTEAASCFARAQALGYVPAKYFLARCYRFGVGVEQDYARASVLYDESALDGYPMAMVMRGYMYEFGLSGYTKEPNHKAASACYDLAIEKYQHSLAMYRRAYLHCTIDAKKNGDFNPSRARELLLKSLQVNLKSFSREPTLLLLALVESTFGKEHSNYVLAIKCLDELIDVYNDLIDGRIQRLHMLEEAMRLRAEFYRAGLGERNNKPNYDAALALYEKVDIDGMFTDIVEREKREQENELVISIPNLSNNVSSFFTSNARSSTQQIVTPPPQVNDASAIATAINPNSVS